MRKPLVLAIAIAVLGTPAIAQVRPENCQPVLPVVDRVASVLPQDVITQPASPTTLAKKRFLGLPLLLPALAGLGGVVGVAASSRQSVSSTNTVSPS